MTDFCQCEHNCHPSDDDATPEQRKRDNPCHVYGIETDNDLTLVSTLYGDYKICQVCQQDHPIPEEYLV